jgi:hypothetical protein
MSTGRVSESFAPIGSNLPGYDNYFCRDCRRIVHVRKGSPAFGRAHSGMHAADGVRGVRDGAEAKNRRKGSGLLTACARRTSLESTRASSPKTSLCYGAASPFAGVPVLRIDVVPSTWRGRWRSYFEGSFTRRLTILTALPGR